MKTNNHAVSGLVAACALLCSAGVAHAQELLNNGGFESGLGGWSRVDQVGSDGTFHLQSGTTSPINGFSVPAPRQGLNAAMTDSGGPGSHVLYQDFVVPLSVPVATLRFSLFIRNAATAFTTPNTLDFSTPALNQQARVDIMTAAADPFSVGGVDVLQNIFQTSAGSPIVTGYNDFTIDLSSLLAAHAGETLRIRFAETDNVNTFNFGVDAVSLTVPAPSVLALIATGSLTASRRRRS